MTQFSRETIRNRINRSYSLSRLGGNIFFVILLIAFTLTFPEAFDVISYPAVIPVLIALLSFAIYTAGYIAIHRIDDGTDEAVQRIITIDQHSTYYRNMVTLILLPAFGVQYAHLFWFVAGLTGAPIFISAFISHRLKIISIFAPLVTLLIHYLYWNLPVLFSGAPAGAGKSFQPVELGFAIILVFLLYQAYQELAQNTRISANFTFDDRIIDRYVKQNGLTERERDVLVKVLQGKSSKQIGTELFISSGTVRNHLSNIFAKTGTHSRLELASQTYASSPD